MGIWIIGLIAIISTVLVFFLPRPQTQGKSFWTFAKPLYENYQPVVTRWNETRPPEERINMVHLQLQALERRLMSSFLSGTPGPDLVEVERATAGQAFRGGPQDIGLSDLTERIRKEGLLERINPPSLALWTRQGRIYGLPHDVHPVLLAYRADIVEAAGIDVSEIETWEDFSRIMAPLMADRDDQGRPKRYLLNLWETNTLAIEVLLLQAGGSLFNSDEQPTLDSDRNVHVVATLVSWIAGPARIAADAPEYTASGNSLKLQGFVIASVMPDWLGGFWKGDMPSLSGKLKLMPLPAWEKGGLRTSVAGGTMLGLPKAGRNPDLAWEFAIHLYFNPDVAVAFYGKTGIIPPIPEFWSLPAFNAPDPYFSGQPAGQLFIQQAPYVPARINSPYYNFSLACLTNAVGAVKQRALDENNFSSDFLSKTAAQELAKAQAHVRRQMERDLFVDKKE